MGRHISDTRTMHWEIYYIHLQSGRMLFLDTPMSGVGWLPGTLKWWKSADKHRSIDEDSIAENNGWLTVPASSSLSFCVAVCYIHVIENERRLDEQLQDVSSVRAELNDKKVKVNELEASCS